MKGAAKKLPKLERYNQILWAVIGSGVLLVVVITVLAGLGAALYSLLVPNRGGMPIATIEDTPEGQAQKAAVYDFCQPLDVHASPYQLIRVVSDQLVVRNKPASLSKRRSAGYSSNDEMSPYYGTCGIHGGNRPSAMVNVLVRHNGTNAMHLLLKENAVIHSLEYPQPPANRTYPEEASSFPPPGVVYWEIAFDDSNGDNVIDERDDLGAYLSGPDGRNLERITPKPSRVLEKTYDKKRNLLTLRILRDTNDDKVLDDNDTPSLIEVSVAKRRMTREVLNAATLTGLMRQAEPVRQAKPMPGH